MTPAGAGMTNEALPLVVEAQRSHWPFVTVRASGTDEPGGASENFLHGKKRPAPAHRALAASFSGLPCRAKWLSLVFGGTTCVRMCNAPWGHLHHTHPPAAGSAPAKRGKLLNPERPCSPHLPSARIRARIVGFAPDSHAWRGCTSQDVRAAAIFLLARAAGQAHHLGVRTAQSRYRHRVFSDSGGLSPAPPPRFLGAASRSALSDGGSRSVLPGRFSSPTI